FAVVPFVALALVPNFDWGWRVLFVMGALGGLIIGFTRRGLPPSIHWLVGEGRLDEAEATLRAAESLAEERLGQSLGPPGVPPARSDTLHRSDFQTLLSSPLLGRLVLLGALWFVYYVGNYGWLTLAADLFSSHGFSLKQSIGSLSLTGLGFVAGSIAAVYSSDRVDRRRVAAVLGVIWAATLLGIGYYASEITIPILGFIASFTIGFIIPVLYTITGENFPTRVRATGVSLSDGFGHLGGAFCGQIILGVEGIYGFHGAFVSMAITGLIAAVLVSLIRKSPGETLD
ncbi:MAG: MFS transporter, partial [Myxococcota bacterium]